MEFFPDGKVMKEVGWVWTFKQDLSDSWVLATTNASSALCHGTVAFKRSVPQQQVKVECRPFPKFKAVEIAVDVGRGRMVLVPEDVGSPAVAVSAREVSTCKLLENMCDMQGLQGSYFGDVSAIPQVLDKGRKRKGPLVGADCEEERGITILTYGICEVEILVLPKRLREGLILQASVRGAARLFR